jgi:hypothetical protein
MKNVADEELRKRQSGGRKIAQAMERRTKNCVSDGAADEYGCEWHIDVGNCSERKIRESSNCKKEDVRNAKRGLYMPSFDIVFFTGLFISKSAK